MQIPENSTSRLGCLGRLVFILVWLWVFFVTLVRISSQILFSGALTLIPDPVWALFPAIQGLLLILPLIPLAWLTRSEPWRSVYRTWLAGACYVMLLAPVSLFFPAAAELQAVLNILLSLIFCLLLFALTRRSQASSIDAGSARTASADSGQNPPPAAARKLLSSNAFWIALLLAGMFGWPWLAWGALGSLLDVILSVSAGLALGLAVSTLLLTVWFPGMRRSNMNVGWYFLFAGFIAGTALFLTGSGVGYPFGGMQLLLVIALPSFGWAAARLYQLSENTKREENTTGILSVFLTRRHLPILLLLGVSAAFPLALVDADELALVISGTVGELFSWVLSAAGVSATIGLLSALVFLVHIWLTRRDSLSASSSSVVMPLLATLTWIIGFAVYLVVGQPGFYGEQLFVVLHDQADVSTAVNLPDPAERRRFVYQTLTSHANSSQSGLRANLDRFNITYQPYYLVNGIQVRGGPLVRLWLASRPEVDRILQNPELRPLPQPPPVSSGTQPMPDAPQWNLTLIGADRVWKDLGITGRGVTVGQSDSGVQASHPELADSYRGRDGDNDYNWFDPWNSTTQPSDIGGHGTHTLGSILGNTTGVAPDADWIACVNLGRNLGNPGFYLDCLQFMLAPFPIGGDPFLDGDTARGAQILNNSWGCPSIEGCDVESLLPAVQALNAAGIFVVASAGNDGPFCSTISEPIAIYDPVFSVGSVDSLGNLSLFSSRGPVVVDGSSRVKPDIIAPGEMVLSAYPEDTYAVLSGTSMAGPHVAGTVALMWSANPALIGDIGRTRDILAKSAQPYNQPISNCPGSQNTPSTAVGYGLLDAYAAVSLAIQDR